MNKNLWRNKNVLITGFDGFLGSNMTKTLLDAGSRVVGLDIRTDRKDNFLTKQDYSKMTVIKGSVSNYALLNKILNKHHIDIVLHLAAEAIVGKCNENPLRNFSSNVEGTWKMLEACRNYGNIEAIVVASSDKAYGCHKKLPYREDAALIGSHPYDVSKSCADLITYTYFNTYKLPVAVTRCGNIYGPGDFNYSRIVPDAIRCALTGKTLSIRSDGTFTRDYVYVDDIVNGYLMLAEQLKKKKLGGEAFNFSDENPITVIEFINNIYNVAKLEPLYKVLNIAKYEIKHQYLDSQKARRILGWKPKNSLTKGLIKTISWYKDYYLNSKTIK